MSTQRPSDGRPAGAEPRPTGRWLAADEPPPSTRAPFTFDPHRTERLRTHVAD